MSFEVDHQGRRKGVGPVAMDNIIGHTLTGVAMVMSGLLLLADPQDFLQCCLGDDPGLYGNLYHEETGESS